MPYSLDTSALIDLRDRYPPDIFGALWHEIENAAVGRELLLSEEVKKELEKKQDELCLWVRAHPVMVEKTNPNVQATVRDIMRIFPNFVDVERMRSVGDPFVVAVARHLRSVVVTSEKPSRGSGRPKIPDVCAALAIRCIGLLDMFRELKWKL